MPALMHTRVSLYSSVNVYTYFPTCAQVVDDYVCEHRGDPCVKRVLNELAVLVEEKKQTVASLLEQLDQNGDGLITLKELKVGVATVLGMELSTAEATAIMRWFDRDGANSIEVEELTQALNRHRSPAVVENVISRLVKKLERLNQSAYELMGRLDKNGDGEVSPNELLLSHSYIRHDYIGQSCMAVTT